MDQETTHGLYAMDESARYDAACKRVLSEKAILARIMKACLEEYKDCSLMRLLTCSQMGRFLQGPAPERNRPIGPS